MISYLNNFNGNIFYVKLACDTLESIVKFLCGKSVFVAQLADMSFANLSPALEFRFQIKTKYSSLSTHKDSASVIESELFFQL